MFTGNRSNPSWQAALDRQQQWFRGVDSSLVHGIASNDPANSFNAASALTRSAPVPARATSRPPPGCGRWTTANPPGAHAAHLPSLEAVVQIGGRAARRRRRALLPSHIGRPGRP